MGDVTFKNLSINTLCEINLLDEDPNAVGEGKVFDDGHRQILPVQRGRDHHVGHQPRHLNQRSGSRVQGSRLRVQGLRFRVQGSGFRVQG